MTSGITILFPALGSIILSWVCGWLIFAGIGLLLARAARVELNNGGHLLDCFWAGWAASLIFLMYWHFLLPVDGQAALAIALLGAFGWIINGRKVSAPIPGLSSWRAILFIVWMLLVSLWVAD